MTKSEKELLKAIVTQFLEKAAEPSARAAEAAIASALNASTTDAPAAWNLEKMHPVVVGALQAILSRAMNSLAEEDRLIAKVAREVAFEHIQISRVYK